MKKIWSKNPYRDFFDHFNSFFVTAISIDGSLNWGDFCILKITPLGWEEYENENMDCAWGAV